MVDHFGVNCGAAVPHAGDGGSEGVDVVDSVLEEVSESCRAVGEERSGPGPVDVSAEDQYPDVRVGGAGGEGAGDALVGVGGRHADVHDDDVGSVGVENSRQAHG